MMQIFSYIKNNKIVVLIFTSIISATGWYIGNTIITKVSNEAVSLHNNIHNVFSLKNSVDSLRHENIVLEQERKVDSSVAAKRYAVYNKKFRTEEGKIKKLNKKVFDLQKSIDKK